MALSVASSAPVDSDECSRLWDQAVTAGAEAVLNAGGKKKFSYDFYRGIVYVIPEDAYGYCEIILEGKHDFSRWLVRKGVGKRFPRGCVTIQNMSGTSLAVTSELCARAIAEVLEESDVPIIRIEP